MTESVEVVGDLRAGREEVAGTGAGGEAGAAAEAVAGGIDTRTAEHTAFHVTRFMFWRFQEAPALCSVIFPFQLNRLVIFLEITLFHCCTITAWYLY